MKLKTKGHKKTKEKKLSQPGLTRLTRHTGHEI